MSKEQKEYSRLEELLNSEIMENYNNSIVENSIKYARKTDKVVDFGAGIGTLSNIFKDQHNIQPICIEIDDKNKKYLSDRGFTYFDSLDSTHGNIDLIFSSNVLEHIDDDVRVLQEMWNNLRDGGQLYLYLPAKMALWSRLDEIVGHYRRYEIKELKQKCEAVGFTVKRIHYADCAGFFASLLMKVVGYNADDGIGSVRSLEFYDKWLFPISALLDKLGAKYLFGKNLVLLAEKQLSK